MRAIVIYESLTGNTRKASELIGSALRAEGHDATVCSITAVDHQALSDADLVIIGSWTDGMFVVGQRPGRAGRLRKLPVMNGKKAVVFCTFAINSGKVLEKMTAIVQGLGADVLGGMALRRDQLDQGVRDFVGRTLAAVG